MDNKFISRDTLRKRKARENETSSQRETRLAKQREITRQKRARENAEEREVRDVRDKERKRVKLATETDEQREKRLSNYCERRKYLKNISKYNDPRLEFATKKSAATKSAAKVSR
ncbi:unnamed protein product [Rhizophagus irregularis]|uniref:Uncharacterized protein n=1 Tax=Rhizophagus irregularis TaxID=588596 RepID=A0A2N1NNT4_9GLOM|nr:hypothetical protein RhiirC2_708073 [Rhizophagus irregularis]CAB4382385.1 unnamed protein product [Rhizophagus irregularis]